jgi:hypothetical protein
MTKQQTSFDVNGCKARIFGAIAGYHGGKKRCKCGRVKKRPYHCCSSGCSSILARVNVSGKGFSANTNDQRADILR